MSEHIARHRLEALAGGDGEETDRRHLEACRSCASRLEALSGARDRWNAAHPAPRFAREVLARAASAGEPSIWARLRAWWRPRSLALGLAVAAAAAVLLVVVRPDRPRGDGPGSGIRFKGGASLQVFARTQGAVRPLQDGDAVAPGDQLAFGYFLPQPRYLVLWGVDRSGEMTRYFPQPGTDPAPLPAGRGQLPVGVELDARRGEERFIAVLSSAPLDEAISRRAAQGGADLPGVEVMAVRFVKP